MLVNLHVKNLALIEEAEVDFNEGLNVLTGETGAGKSIIIGSVNIALGQKVSNDIIRKDAQFALVEAVFDVKDAEKIKKLEALGVDMSDEQVIISRKIMPNRNLVKVNGETVTLAFVKEITSYLIDIHGQHEHQSLLYKSNYIDILDRFAINEVTPVLDKLKELCKEYAKVKENLEEYSMDEEKLLREISFLEYEINEIDSAALKSGEDVTCQNEYKKISNSKKILENLSQISAGMGFGENGDISQMISQSVRLLNNVVQYDDKLQNALDMMCDFESMYNDISHEINGYIEEFEFSDEYFYELEERMNLINNLKAKYGSDIEGIYEYREAQAVKLENYRNFEENKTALEKTLAKLNEEILELCRNLTKIRESRAVQLEARIIAALEDLNFNDVRFKIQFSALDNFTAKGMDSIEFMISTNPGEDIRPLQKTASGGELSRIMLALKSVFADNDDIESLIFDEIDTGISGRTAQMVAEKMAFIAKSRQVICITHLPQIAAMADTHFLIEKNVLDEKTHTNIKQLGEEEIVEELGRMLGGAKVTQAVLDSAREMKDLAKNTKTN